MHPSPHCGCHRPGRALLRCYAPPVGSYSKMLPYLQYAHLVSRRLRCRASASASSGRALALVPVERLPRLDLAATETKGAGWGGRATVRHARVCVCVCARACACAHVDVAYTHSLIQSIHVDVAYTHSLIQSIRVCVCASLVDDILYFKAAHLSAWCVHLAVLGTAGGGLASSANEWPLKRLAAVIAQRGVSRHPSQASSPGYNGVSNCNPRSSKTLKPAVALDFLSNPVTWQGII